jgi:type II secretory pathway pseudopilin PulG
MNFRLRKRRREQGYVLLVLLLAVSLLSIGFLAMTQSIEFQIKRDREEEFIHRGVEYSRAVRRYVKKYGHYPASVEALESSDNLRFLRKRYKDPLTGKDFKLLYYGDVPGLNQGTLAGGNPSVPTPNPQVAAPQTNNGQSAVPPSGTAPSAPASDSSVTLQLGQSASGQGEPTTPQTPDEVEAAAAEAAAAQALAAQNAADEQLAGTRVIVGVTSYSDRKTIRVFNKKNHYNQWQFIYDPSSDRAIMRGPNQPLPIGTGQAPPGQNGAPTSNVGVTPGQN